MHWNEHGQLVFQHISDVRIMGVLQRIAVCYMLAAVIALFLREKAIVIISAVLLLGYWMILYFLGDDGRQYTLEGNAVRKLDLRVLGAARMYRENGISFDPEGILSSLPATVNVLAGFLAGNFFIRRDKEHFVFYRLLGIGVVVTIIALSWHQVFPMNKKLWTSSFVLYSSGIAIVIMAILYYLVELKAITIGTKFLLIFGRNPLALYVLSNLLLILLIFPVGSGTFSQKISADVFQQAVPGPMGSLLFAISFALACWVAGWALDRKKIYLRL